MLAFQNVGHFTGSFIKTECESCEIPSLAFWKVRLRGEKQLDFDLLRSTHTLPPPCMHTSTSLDLKTTSFPKDTSQRSFSFFSLLLHFALVLYSAIPDIRTAVSVCMYWERSISNIG